MKKLIKVLLILAAVCGVGGIITYGVACVKANSLLNPWIQLSEIIRHEKNHTGFNDTEVENLEIHEFEEIKGLVVDVEVGDLKLIPTTNSIVTVKTELPESFHSTVQCDENKILHVSVKGDTLKKNNESKITISIPTGFYLESSKINVSVGKIDIKTMNLINPEISTAVGDIELKDVVLDQGNIHLSLGNLEVEGYIFGHVNFINSMGDISIDPANQENELGLDLNVNMGTIEINDKKLQENVYQTHSEHENVLTAQANMGTIDIEFAHHN